MWLIPQQVYMSTPLLDVFSTPVSWATSLVILSVGMYLGDSGKHRCNTGEISMHFVFGLFGEKNGFWSQWAFYIFVLTLPFVYLLFTDKHNWFNDTMSEMQGDPQFTRRTDRQREMQSLKTRRGYIQLFYWIWSQILWMWLFKFQVMVFDCAHIRNIRNANSWKHYLMKMYHYQVNSVVMDEDRGMECMYYDDLRPGHAWKWLFIAIFTFVLLWFFTVLSIPLLVAQGDADLVKSMPKRIRFTPLMIFRVCQFKVQRQKWPKYAGVMTRTHTYFFFEFVLMIAKILIPTCMILSTNVPTVRFLVNFFVSLLVFFVASWIPPVKACEAQLLIIGLTMFMCLIPGCRYFFYESLLVDPQRCDMQPQNVTFLV